MDPAVDAQFSDLFEEVEDLIKRVADIDSPEIQKIRAKVHMALMVTKSALAKSALQDGSTQMRRQAVRAASTTDGYLRDYPWQALGLGTLFGFGIGFGIGVLVSRRD